MLHCIIGSSGVIPVVPLAGVWSKMSNATFPATSATGHEHFAPAPSSSPSKSNDSALFPVSEGPAGAKPSAVAQRSGNVTRSSTAFRSPPKPNMGGVKQALSTGASKPPGAGMGQGGGGARQYDMQDVDEEEYTSAGLSKSLNQTPPRADVAIRRVSHLDSSFVGEPNPTDIARLEARIGQIGMQHDSKVSASSAAQAIALLRHSVDALERARAEFLKCDDHDKVLVIDDLLHTDMAMRVPEICAFLGHLSDGECVTRVRAESSF